MPRSAPLKSKATALPRRARPRSTPIPLLPAVAASLVLLASVQLWLWWWQARLPAAPAGTPAAASTPLTGNPFVDLPKMHPLSPEVMANTRPPLRVQAPALPQNLQFGDAHAQVVVTVLTDPSCGACRERVRSLLAPVPKTGVKIVYKFWPGTPGRLTPGTLLLLAQQQGVTAAFWHRLEAATGDLDDGALLNLLDASGVPLAEQRTALTASGDTLTAALESDISLGHRNHLPPPPVLLVDDYLLDGKILRPDNLADYVARRLNGESLGK